MAGIAVYLAIGAVVGAFLAWMVWRGFIDPYCSQYQDVYGIMLLAFIVFFISVIAWPVVLFAFVFLSMLGDD